MLDHFGRNVLRIDAVIDRAIGIGPDLPRRRRLPQPILEPRLLLGAEDRLRRLVLAEVGHL